MRQRPRCAGLKQQPRVTTVPPVGAEHDRQSPGRGLEHGVETGPPETTPDVRHCARTIQRREYPDPIAQDNGVTLRLRYRAARGKAVRRRACFARCGQGARRWARAERGSASLRAARGRPRQMPGGERPHLRARSSPPPGWALRLPAGAVDRRARLAFTRATTLSKRGSPRTWIRSGATPSRSSRDASLRRDRGGDGDGAVPGFQQPPSEPAKAAAARAHRGGDESYVGPAAGRSGGRARARHRAWRRPAGPAEASAAADPRFRADRTAGSPTTSEAIRLRQRLGRRTEMGIHDLALGAAAAQREQHALGLPALSHRGRVKPDQRPAQVPVRSGPVQQPFTGSRSGAQPGPDPGTQKAQCGSHRRAETNGSAIGPRGATAWRNVAGVHSKRKRLAARPADVATIITRSTMFHLQPRR